MGRPTTWPALVEPEDGSVDYSRLSFDLTYAHCPNRSLAPDGMGGPNIPSATDPETFTSGAWSADISDFADDPVWQVFGAAIEEAVHEACEWVQLDGAVLVDPHGPMSGIVHAAARDCAGRIFDDLLARLASSSDMKEGE